MHSKIDVLGTKIDGLFHDSVMKTITSWAQKGGFRGVRVTNV